MKHRQRMLGNGDGGGQGFYLGRLRLQVELCYLCGKPVGVGWCLLTRL